MHTYNCGNPDVLLSGASLSEIHSNRFRLQFNCVYNWASVGFYIQSNNAGLLIGAETFRLTITNSSQSQYEKLRSMQDSSIDNLAIDIVVVMLVSDYRVA